MAGGECLAEGGGDGESNGTEWCLPDDVGCCLSVTCGAACCKEADNVGEGEVGKE